MLVVNLVAATNLRNIDNSTLQNVPGTVLLNEEGKSPRAITIKTSAHHISISTGAGAHAEEAVHNLKHGTGKNAHIVLSPQPSEDPNDPLNWPMWRKEVIIAILSLGAMLNAGTNVSIISQPAVQPSKRLVIDLRACRDLSSMPRTSPCLRPSACQSLQWSWSLDTTSSPPAVRKSMGGRVTQVSTGNRDTHLPMFVCFQKIVLTIFLPGIGPFVSAFSRKYGKRPVFLVSTLLDIIGTAIGESQISYNYLLAARIVQGFSTSAFESLIVATVGDLYFVHQRGVRISFINFVLNSASSLASIICGVVFAHLGWLWLFRRHSLPTDASTRQLIKIRSLPDIPRHPVRTHVPLLSGDHLHP